MKIRDLILDSPSGGFYGGGSTFETLADAAIVNEVLRIDGNRVDCTCMRDPRTVFYSLMAPDRRTAEKVAGIWRENKGRTLAFVGEIEVAATA